MSTESSAKGTHGGVLTVKEAARALRVSKWTVYRLVKAGDLPAGRVGRHLRIPAAGVTALLTPTVEAA